MLIQFSRYGTAKSCSQRHVLRDNRRWRRDLDHYSWTIRKSIRKPMLTFQMAAVVAGVAVAMVLLQRFYVRAGRELRRLDLTTRSPIFTLFSET